MSTKACPRPDGPPFRVKTEWWMVHITPMRRRDAKLDKFALPSLKWATFHSATLIFSKCAAQTTRLMSRNGRQTVDKSSKNYPMYSCERVTTFKFSWFADLILWANAMWCPICRRAPFLKPPRHFLMASQKSSTLNSDSPESGYNICRHPRFNSGVELAFCREGTLPHMSTIVTLLEDSLEPR